MLSTFQRDSELDEIAGALERDGVVIVERFLPEATVERLCLDFGPHLDAVPWGNTDSGEDDEFFGRTTKRLHGCPS